MSSLRVARDQVKLARSYDIEDSASVLSHEELLASVWDLTPNQKAKNRNSSWPLRLLRFKKPSRFTEKLECP